LRKFCSWIESSFGRTRLALVFCGKKSRGFLHGRGVNGLGSHLPAVRQHQSDVGGGFGIPGTNGGGAFPKYPADQPRFPISHDLAVMFPGHTANLTQVRARATGFASTGKR
jgi:hypothetical protein